MTGLMLMAFFEGEFLASLNELVTSQKRHLVNVARV